MTIPFQRQFEFRYGVAETVSPLVRRLVAHNPSAFTWHGTNTYIIGRGHVTVLDPGPLLAGHIDAIRTALQGETIDYLLVTHTHRDHSPACRPLAAISGAPGAGFGPHGDGRGEVEEGADHEFIPDIRLVDGDRLSGDGWTLECVHTPGHTSNHLCYALHEEQALFTGDHIMAWSTSVIAPPDGDLGEYLASLDRLLARPERRYWPAHGPAIDQPIAFVEGFIEHRQARLREILDGLQRGLDTIPLLVDANYPQLAPALRPAAARSTLASLLYLRRQGQVSCDLEPGLASRYYPA